MKLVILDGHTENPGDLSWDALSALGHLTVYDRTPIDDQEEIIRRIGDCEVVITNKTPLTASTIDRCPNLQCIAVLATGYNVADYDYAKTKGIPVCNVPAYGTVAVAQHTIAMLLEICNRVAHHSQTVYDGKWCNHIDFCYWDYPLIELEGKTLGVIGFGRIGQQTATIAKALGMHILAYNRSQSEEGKALATYVDMDTLLARSDVITLHCPLFPETQGLINRHSIKKMKDGAILLNTGRGALIVEEDLAHALNSGKLYAAALDVVSVEPIQSDNPLLSAQNCFITPHISWASKESRQRILNCTVENVAQFIGGTPIHVVNPVD